MFSNKLIDQLNSFKQVIDHDVHPEQNVKESLKLHYKNFELFYEIITEEFTANFTTLFSRITYIAALKIWPKGLIRLAHIIRKSQDDAKMPEEIVELIGQILPKYIEWHMAAISSKEEILIDIPQGLLSYFNTERFDKVGYFPFIEGLVVNVDKESKIISFMPKSADDTTYHVLYNVDDTNEIFTKAIESVITFMPYPIQMNLIDVDILTNDRWVPKAFIIFPDYLVDVTTVASVHNDSFTSSWLYILSKFRGKSGSSSILVGNVANYFLDLLVKDNDANYRDQIRPIFNQDPLLWAIFDDATVKKALTDLEVHFDNLKRVINQDFSKFNINTGKIYLEPSFYCKEYGIQGRLDLFHINDERTKAEIIELKSGKIFKPNGYGINHAHYSQTLLYDIIIKSVYRNKLKSTNFILYSSLEKENLKLAPAGSRTINELLKIRNEIVLIEHAIVFDENVLPKVYRYLNSANFKDLKGFSLTDLKEFEGIYLSLRSFEKEYFTKFSKFIANEHLLAKTGEHGISRSNGLSGLWLESIDEKIDRFAILNHMIIIKNASDELFPTMTFQKTALTAKLSNFRVGDIAVLYPYTSRKGDVLHHEIFKCTILGMEDDLITIRMRHPQINHHIFKINEYWHLEEDVLDSSFKHMYRGLFDFASVHMDKRNILLGIKRPEFNDQDVDIELDESLTIEQKSIIRKILQTKDYLLLWGPPGTGKTSQIIKHTSKALFTNHPKTVIYLAYTNRAVDEICDALSDAGLKENFIRIGSRHAIDSKYETNLLDIQIGLCKTRSEIIQKIKNCRIYVSTISSLSGKTEIFDLISIHTAIVDEASQILEPSLIGILSRFERFILIGDHKQLPAVVTQKKSNLKIENEELLKIGFQDLSMSFFERLLLQCQKNNWLHAIEILSQQGRMHIDIMAFVSRTFYADKLKPIPSLPRLVASIDQDLYPKDIFSQRLLYIPSQSEKQANWKTNHDEATKVIQLIEIITASYASKNKALRPHTIGVITPYRAQIALIKSMMPVGYEITVDTVERYQGSARDIILFSTCTSTQAQLERLVSKSQEGIDRKLNVAITRAKEFFVLFGNEDILLRDGTYQELIRSSDKLSL
jgi:DNA replication ATP-dependent helicase Dna2